MSTPQPPSPSTLLRPWQKFLNLSALSFPISLSESTYRITQNLSYFLPNYLLLILSIFLLTLITRPLALLFFICLLCTWVYLLSTRGLDEPITVINYDVDFKYVIGFLSVLTLIAVFWCNAWGKVFVAVIVGGLIVVIHSVLMAPEENDGTPYGSLLNVVDSPVDGGYTSV